MTVPGVARRAALDSQRIADGWAEDSGGEDAQFEEARDDSLNWSPRPSYGGVKNQL